MGCRLTIRRLFHIEIPAADNGGLPDADRFVSGDGVQSFTVGESEASG